MAIKDQMDKGLLVCDHLEVFRSPEEAKRRELEVIRRFTGKDWNLYLNTLIPKVVSNA